MTSRKKTTDPIDATGNPVTNWRQWISRTKATVRLGISWRQFDRIVSSGELPQGLTCPDASQRWDPDVIEKLAAQLAEKEPEQDPIEARHQLDLARAQAATANVDHQHVERMLQLLETPIRTAMAQLRQANLDLREENAELRERLHAAEQARSDFIAQQEDLLSEKTARELATSEASATRDRKDKMFGIFSEVAKPVLTQVVKTLGVNPQDQKKVDAVIALANDLDPALLETLAASGALTSEQIAHVEVIIGKTIKKEQPPS